MATYTTGSVSNNNGLQQINVTPYQELTSFNANKHLYGLIEPGVYNCEVSVTLDAGNYIFTISSGTVFVFQKEHEGYPLISKVVLQEDATIEVASATISGYTDDSLLVIASWFYDITDTSNIYANLTVQPNTLDNRNYVETNTDLILATLLNHDVAKNSQPEEYKIAYQYQEYRNVFKNLYEINKSFPITFAGDGLSLTIGEGNCILGDTYITNTSTLTCSTADDWPIPLDDSPASDYYQIDVLRLKTEDSSTSLNTPYLAWESFSKLNAGFTNIREFINGYDFTFMDQGVTILFVVRALDGLLDDTPIWPEDTYIPNPLMHQIGIPETVSRFKLPIY